MLAIAANSFGQPSETFIRAHVRDIAPGRTVLLCRDGAGPEALGLPTLSNLRSEPTPRHFGERVARGLRFRFHRYVDPALRGADERRVRSFLEQHRVRAVLAEYGMNGSLLRRVCLRSRIPLFVHFHGFDATKAARSTEQQRHYRRLFRDAAGVIAPSRFLCSRLQRLGCPSGKLHVSPCGVDVQTLPESKRERGRLLAVGRLVEKKAPLTTLRAFARVATEIPEARLDFVGDGPLWAACGAEVTRLGLDGRVVLHGSQPHSVVQALMSQAALFVQHSVEAADGDCEGLPVAILEAMGSSLPVVSTRHSGIPEAVNDGDTGLLVDEHDVTGMAAAMIALLRDPDRAVRMGRAGRARVEAHFSLEKTAARLRQIMGLDDG